LYSVVGLEELPGSVRGSAVPGGINNFGQVVGWASFMSAEGHGGSRGLDQAFLWSEGGIRVIRQGIGVLREDLHSSADAMVLREDLQSRARAINDRGLVVGGSLTHGGHHHAFLWNELTGMEDLGTLTPGVLGATSSDVVFSEANAINNSGEVVGGSFSSERGESEEGGKHAFFWSESTGMQDLNVLLPPNSGWTLLRAHDINESGQILCEGLHTGSDNAQERRVCVLIPTFVPTLRTRPEP
jgi:probable HAF family extracellular repeat protein